MDHQYNQPETELLHLLAERAGIASEYHDIAGVRHVTSDATTRALLSAMGFRIGDRTALVEELMTWDQRPWVQGVEPVVILREGEPVGTWLLHVECDDEDEARLQIHWVVYGEQGENRHERAEGPGVPIHGTRVIGRRYVRLSFPLPEGLPLGYYDVKVWVKGGQAVAERQFRLIVAPRRCYVPASIESGARQWGLAVQLYGLRSNRNWGIGDCTDLSALVEWAGRTLGCGLVGVNPLHALKNTAPYHLSPYSPNSRLYLNEVYLDVDRVLECQTSPDVAKRLADPAFRAQVEAARQRDCVDYEAVASAKRAVLDLCYRAFLKDNFEGQEPDVKPNTARGWFFHTFVQQEGEPLAQYALFQALEDERQFVQSRSVVWADWPEAYRVPGTQAVEEFKRRHMKKVRYFQYVQWLLAEQLAAVQRQAHEAGLSLGLYHDLALGSDRYGADGWRFQSLLALKADCGAPPDAFAPEGQNWGIAPADPLRLRASGYRYVTELLRHNLRYGGALRIDHVMALFRLFWIPRGQPASQGTYVHYPADDLLAIVALESTRAKAMVIGEDLGTVPDWVRDRLAATGVLSYRVLYFERTGHGRFTPPAAYPAQALGVVTTHDLPTLFGYWEGCDIETRAGLGLFPHEEARRAALAERHVDKARLLEALQAEGLLPDGVSTDPAQVPVMTPALASAVYEYLARTPCWLMLVNLEDLVGERAQANLPGTLNEHPNWSRKLSRSVEDLQQDARMHTLAAQLRAVRPPV